MEKMYIIHLFFTIFLSYLSLSQSERLHEQIYSSIEGGAPCFRRLNGTHQAGCSSTKKGAVGAVLMIKELNDAIWLTQNATSGLYMAVVSTALFQDVIEEFLSHPENVAGILVYENASLITSAFTQDSKCPNEYSSGPGSTCSSAEPAGSVWNEKGTNLIRRDIPFPIFFLPESRLEEIKKIEECYERYNLDRSDHNGRPLCSVQLRSFMYAAVNTVVCTRRSASSAILTPTKVCDPLGDQNVYYSLFPRPKENKDAKKPVILVTARIDSASLFDGLSPGTASSVVGMVTLIAAAAALTEMIPQSKADSYDTNVLFTLFNGEAFDYIGSQKVAYDISKTAWPQVNPLSPADIPLHIELGQIGGALLANRDNQSWPFYAFAPTLANTMSQVSEIVNELSLNLNQYNMSLILTATDNIPPSSLHSFRRILKNVTESGTLAEVLIVDHNEHFTNMFYNSALDGPDKIGFEYHNISISSNGTFISTEELIKNGTMKETESQVKIAQLATSLARTLYKKVTNEKYTGDVSASAHLIDEMLYCFLTSQVCRLLLAADFGQSGATAESFPRKPAPLYVSVSHYGGTAPLFAGHLLALLTGTPLPAVNRTMCDKPDNKGFSYLYLKGWNHTGICIRTTMNFSQAISPAFTSRDYDFTSGMYSTWTESVWQLISARVFVSASGGGARAALIAGLVATAIAAFLTFWIKSNSQRIFVNAPAGSLVSTDAATGILRTVNC
ncbi:nicastrin [Ostrinia furnacalis]|uniref:nicastrin n=1 Tax=Ostrinia furnacalis TaxID=93504 RepID=UPI001040C73A|nr:nicastrin [Ostrinia furnacalis]